MPLCVCKNPNWWTTTLTTSGHVSFIESLSTEKDCIVWRQLDQHTCKHPAVEHLCAYVCVPEQKKKEDLRESVCGCVCVGGRVYYRVCAYFHRSYSYTFTFMFTSQETSGLIASQADLHYFSGSKFILVLQSGWHELSSIKGCYQGPCSRHSSKMSTRANCTTQTVFLYGSGFTQYLSS